MNYPGITDMADSERLDRYAEMICQSNSMFNLTGFDGIEAIKKHLLISSLEPFSAIDVPRGTSIADLGTGAGIPGVPLSIRFKNADITMFDSTLKKINFVNHALTSLEINNARAVSGRIEDFAKNPVYREKFDWVITRAMADVYTSAELGAPLLIHGGYIYLYVSEKQSVLPEKTRSHLSELGLSVLSENEAKMLMKKKNPGIVMKKTKETDMRFPRRIVAIKRDEEKIRKTPQ